MAASVAMHSYSTKLYAAAFGVADPAGADVSGNIAWSLVGEIISLNGVPMQHSVTRVTHLNSDARAHEKVPGILDGGQVNFKGNYTDATLVQLLGLLPGGGTAAVNDVPLPATPSWGRWQWLLVFPTGAMWYATGFVQGMPVDVPEDDRITFDVTVEISGRPAFTEA